MSTQENLFYYISPPTDGSLSTDEAKLHQVQTFVTGAAAANRNWVTAIESALGKPIPSSGVFLRVEASTNDAFIRFKNGSGAAATTATNGLLIKAGQPGQTFYVNPDLHPTIDVIAPAGAGTIQAQIASPVSGNRRVI